MKPWRSKLAVAALSGAAVAGGFFGGEVLLERVQFARAEAQVETNREQLSHVEDLSSVFRHVGRVVEPSVVNIQVRKTMKNPHRGMDEDLLRKFFHDQNPSQPGTPNSPNTPNSPDTPDENNNGGSDQLEQVGTGSGVIMEVSDGYGYVLTNNHVAGGADEMDITLSDGREVKNGKLLGADAKSDLAVVRIKAENLIPAHWGNSDDLDKGDWVLAFGSPFGYVGSMTHGIVSALNRHDVGIISNGYENFIQVDAPINPGNSGGPLVNIHGEVVGVNTAIASRSGGFQGIGFAIPSNQAKGVYGSLKDHGKVVRGWLGVSIMDVARDPKLAHSFGYNKDTGVLVEDSFPSTPAYGKLKKGDIISAYNGQAVDNVQQLRNTVALTSPGADAKLTVYRDGKYQDVTVKIGDQPEDLALATERNGDKAGDASVPNTAEALGMHLGTLTDDMSKTLGVDAGTSGAVILSVDRGSPAAKAGLRAGDVITDVAGRGVNNARDAAAVLEKADVKKGVRLSVLTRAGSRFVFVQSDENTKPEGDQ